jgi:GT2 family glycosyltransferase
VNSTASGYCLCIPTYKRPQTLINLLDSLQDQSIKLNTLAIVDGDPSSNIILSLLKTRLHSLTYDNVLYIPSNHANLPYQRYLGWKVAKQLLHKYLVYLDDDLIPAQEDSLENLLSSLQQANGIIAVTAHILYSLPKNHNNESNLVKMMGDARAYKAGSITPSGNRIPIEFIEGTKYMSVDYLSGGGMAFFVDVVTDDIFSPDLFAMYEKKIGKGEDTILSLRLKNFGNFLYAVNATFKHPENEAVAYPTHGLKKGFAIAYSRRLINDNYRGIDLPSWKDRAALLKSYFGNTILNTVRLIQNPNIIQFSFALGYLVGALRGLFQKPTAKNLTPEIDWWSDAEKAIAQQVIVQ